MTVLDNIYWVFKQIKKQFVESLLIIIGISLCITAISVSLGFLEGYKYLTSMNEKKIYQVSFEGIEDYEKPIVLVKNETQRDNYFIFQDFLNLKSANLDGLEFVWLSQKINFPNILKYLNIDKTTITYFITPDIQKALNLDVTKGSFIILPDVINKNKVLVLGDELSERLFADKNPVGQELTIFNSVYTVVGIVHSQKENQESLNFNMGIFLPYFNLAELISEKETDKIRIMSIKANKNVEISKFKNQLLDYFKQNYAQPVSIYGQFMELLNYKRITKFTTTILVFFSSCIFAIVFLNTFNSLAFRFQGRYKDISLLKVFGANRKEILKLYLTEVFILSIFGCSLSFFLSYFLILSFRAFDYVIIISIKNVIISVLVSLLIGIFLGLYPSFQVSRVNIIDNIKNN